MLGRHHGAQGHIWKEAGFDRTEVASGLTGSLCRECRGGLTRCWRVSICAPAHKSRPLGPAGPSGVTSEHPSLVLNWTSLPPDPSLHGETFWTLPPERTEQPFFAAFSGGRVSTVGTVLWPHGPSLGPGCLPASSPHLSLRLSLLEISTPTVVLPTPCQEQATPHKPLFFWPAKPDRPHTAGLAPGGDNSRTAACLLNPDSTCHTASSKGPQRLVA